MNLVEILQAQPLRRKARRQRFGLRILEHALDLRGKYTRSAQRAALRDFQQLVIRARAPEEERQPRGQIEIGDAVVLAGTRGGRRLFKTEQETRAGENRLHRHADTRLEISAVLAALLIELVEAVEIRRGERAAIGLRAQLADDLRRARGL